MPNVKLGMSAILVLAGLLCIGCTHGHNNCLGEGAKPVFSPWECRDILIQYHPRPKAHVDVEDPEHDLLTD